MLGRGLGGLPSCWRRSVLQCELQAAPLPGPAAYGSAEPEHRVRCVQNGFCLSPSIGWTAGPALMANTAEEVTSLSSHVQLQFFPEEQSGFNIHPSAALGDKI